MRADRRGRALLLAAAVVALAPADAPAAPAGATAPPDLSQAPATPAARAWKLPPPVEVTLPNGLRLLSSARRTLPLVHIALAVQAGSELDPADRPGLAAAVARMIDEGGAAGRPASELAAELDALGAELDVVADEGGVRLLVSVRTDALDATLAQLAARVTRPNFDAADWTGVRTRQLADLKQERNEPERVAARLLAATLYGAHPYAHSPLGTDAALQALDVDALRAFHAAHWGPRTTTVAVVGDVDPADARRRVEAAFGKWSGRAVPAAPPPAPARQTGGVRVLLVDRPGAPQSALAVGHIGERYATPDLPAVELLETVLGGAFTSRLVQNLRERHAWTYGVHAEWRLHRQAGPMAITSAVRTDVTADAVREIVAEVKGLLAPIPADELDKARQLVRGRIVDDWSSGQRAALVLAELALHDQGTALFDGITRGIAALAPDTIAQAAGRLLDADALVVIVVGDRKVVEPRLRALPFVKTLELRDVDGQPAAAK